MWADGAIVTDIDGDVFPDLYISFGGPYAEPRRRANELYINNGDLTFTERAEEYGLADTGFSTQSVFFDFNKDGYHDLFVDRKSTSLNSSHVGSSDAVF